MNKEDKFNFVEDEEYLEMMPYEDDLDERSNKEYIRRKIIKETGIDIDENRFSEL